MKSHVLHTVCCNSSGEAAGEILSWSLLGVKELVIGGPEQASSCVALQENVSGNVGGLKHHYPIFCWCISLDIEALKPAKRPNLEFDPASRQLNSRVSPGKSDSMPPPRRRQVKYRFSLPFPPNASRT